MSEPDEDPPVTGGRDLPESLVWRPSKLSEETLACYRAICTDRLLLTTFNEYVLQSRFESLFWHIDAQAEEIRRLTFYLQSHERWLRTCASAVGIAPDSFPKIEGDPECLSLALDNVTDAVFEAQKGEIRRLREVVRPFAIEAAAYGVDASDRTHASVSLGMLRRAAKAMEPQTTKPKD
jgi:hypothetical protein